MASMFRNAIEFFEELGIYDVVLPFLLVFTVTFAILEKSKIFGFYKLDDGVEVTRKNLNAMVAFCLGFITVASSRIVAIINEGLANIMIIMIAALSFLLLAGVFFSEGHFIFDDQKYKWMQIGLVVLVFICTLLIFLHAVKDKNGKPWLTLFWEWIGKQWDSTVVGSIILLALVVFFMFFITKNPKAGGEKTTNGTK